MNKEITKTIKEISWMVDEPTYRADPVLSYSNLSEYQRSGFSGIPHLFDKKESPSLTFGSMVDTILTSDNPLEEYNNKFLCASVPKITDTLKAITDKVFELYGSTYSTIKSIPETNLIDILEMFNYYTNRTAGKRLEYLYSCEDYYNMCIVAQGKTIVTSEDDYDAKACAKVLRESPATREYFNNTDTVINHYQLKFKGEYKGIPMRCMPDILHVDYENKVIVPVDLKTTGNPEWEFYKSFVHWNYDVQARSYYHIIRQCMDKDSYFKNFTLKDYVFVVVNRKSLTPLAWDYPFTTSVGDISIGKDGKIILPYWGRLLEELTYYLKEQPKVPVNISATKGNNLVELINNNL